MSAFPSRGGSCHVNVRLEVHWHVERVTNQTGSLGFFEHPTRFFLIGAIGDLEPSAEGDFIETCHTLDSVHYADGVAPQRCPRQLRQDRKRPKGQYEAIRHRANEQGLGRPSIAWPAKFRGRSRL